MWIRAPKTLKYPRKVTPPQSRSMQLLQIFMWWWFVICRTFAWETHERLLIWGLLIVFGPRSITIWPNNCHTISTNHQYQPMDFLIQPTSLSLKIVPPHSRSFQNVYLPLKSWIPHWSQSMCFVTLSFILLCYCWLHFKSMCYDAALRIAPTTLPFTRIPPLASLAAFQMPRGSSCCHLHHHHLLLLTLFCSPWVICTWRRRQWPIYAIVPSDPLPPFSQPLREVAVSWNGHHGCAVWWNISVKWSECVIQRRGQDLRMGWSRLA